MLLSCRVVVAISCISYSATGHRSWTSHPHFGDDGTLYNCSAAYDKDRYEFIRIPPAQGQRKAPLDGIEVVAAIPMGHEPSYFHSFGMTENYFIFIEGSMFLGSYFKSHYMNELTLKLFNKTHKDMMIFKPEIKSRFFILFISNTPPPPYPLFRPFPFSLPSPFLCLPPFSPLFSPIPPSFS